MARTKISEFSSTAADNTDIDGIDIAEGCAPSGINNAIRTLMADLKDMQTGASGDTFTFASLNATTANIDGGTIDGATIGGTTPATGAFTTLSASSTVSGTGFSNYLASPPAIGGTAAAAGSFTNLSYTGTLTGGTGVINIGSGQIYKDASGNVGIGTSSPSYKLTVAGYSNTAATNKLAIGDVADYQALLYMENATETFTIENTSNYSAGAILFKNNGAERMRIDSSGNVGIGTTAASGKLAVESSGVDPAYFASAQSGYGAQIKLRNLNSGVPNPNKHIRIANSAGQLEIINSAYTATVFQFYDAGTAYNTTGTWGAISDERVKENIESAGEYLDRLLQLRVVKYSLKSENSPTPTKLGFLAGEVEQVFPNLIETTSDTFNNISDLKQIKLSVLTPMLVKAIQEQQAIINSLQNRLTLLEQAK